MSFLTRTNLLRKGLSSGAQFLRSPAARQQVPALSFSGRALERKESFVGISVRKKAGRRTAEEAVNNILYNTPEDSLPHRHVLSCLVDNEPGVLSKISGLLSARGFNIDSLTVSSTDVKELSRMTIVLIGPDKALEQAGRQLEDLCDVWAVVDFSKQAFVERELAMVKVKCFPPSEDEEHKLKPQNPDEMIQSYDDIMASHFHRQAILDIAKMFEAKVCDIGTDSITLEMVSWGSRIDGFIRILQPYGVVEAARSGIIAMMRSKIEGTDDNAGEERTVVNLADLPPS